MIKFGMKGRNENIAELSCLEAEEVFGGAPWKPNVFGRGCHWQREAKKMNAAVN